MISGAVSFLRRRWWIGVFAVATLWVWQSYAVVQCGRRVALARKHLERLVEVRDGLLADNARLSSRGRIESIATVRLGMAPARTDQKRRITDRHNNAEDTHPALPVRKGT